MEHTETTISPAAAVIEDAAKRLRDIHPGLDQAFRLAVASGVKARKARLTVARHLYDFQRMQDREAMAVVDEAIAKLVKAEILEANE